MIVLECHVWGDFVFAMLQKDLEVRAFITNFDLTVEDTSLDNAKLKKVLFYFALFSLIRIFADRFETT